MRMKMPEHDGMSLAREESRHGYQKVICYAVRLFGPGNIKIIYKPYKTYGAISGSRGTVRFESLIDPCFWIKLGCHADRSAVGRRRVAI